MTTPSKNPAGRAGEDIWWREGWRVYYHLKQSWTFTLLNGYVVSYGEDEEDCIDEQLWAIREGLA